MKANNWYHDSSHQIRFSYIVSYKNITCYLFRYSNFRFGKIWFCVAVLLFLWCLFWHSDKFIPHSVFFKRSKLQKYNWLELLKYHYCFKKTILTVTEPAKLLPVFPFLLSLPFCNYVSPCILFSTSMHCIMWSKRYGCWPVSTHQFAISR